MLNNFLLLTSIAAPDSSLPPDSSGAPVVPGWNFFGDLWNKILSFFEENGISILIRVLLALLVIVAGHYLIKLLNHFLIKLLTRRRKSGRHLDRGIITFTSSFTKFVLNVILVFLVFKILRIPLDGIVSIFSAAILAIGLSLQDLLANFANGLLLLSAHHFQTGDYIEVDGISGTVGEFNMMSIVLITPDKRKIIVPNSTVAKNKIINYSSEPTRRISIHMDISYESDLLKAKQLLLETVGSHQLVLKDPAPTVQVEELKDSSVDLVIKCYVLNDNYWDVLYDLNESTYLKLKDSGIAIPYNQLDVHLIAEKEVDRALAAHPEVRVKKEKTAKK